METAMAARKDTQKNATVVVEKVARKGREQWRVASGGEIKSITTRSASTRAMDEAMVIYSSALKRLANR
jgi:hypothetical protein